jgi:hypothetical protein
MRYRCRQLDAGGTRADQHEGHLPITFACIVRLFGDLECAEDFRPDVLDRELPDWRGDLRRSKHLGCRLIEERLKDVVIRHRRA